MAADFTVGQVEESQKNELFDRAKQKFMEAWRVLEEYDQIVDLIHEAGWTQLPFSGTISGYYFSPDRQYHVCDLRRSTCDEIRVQEPQGPVCYTRPTLRDFRVLQVREDFVANFGCMCQYCGSEGDLKHGPDGRSWHIDHLYAKSLGGDSRTDNLVLSCATCNLRKSDQLLRDHLEAICSK